MTTENTPAPEQTFEQIINTHVDGMKTDDAGKHVMPDGLDESTTYAVNAERRRRDTQAAYSKSQNDLKASRAETAALASGWEKEATGLLTPEQSVEMEELKATDPDAWRAKLNEYEAANTEAFGTRRTEIQAKAQQETELDARTRQLEEFNTANPTIAITDELLANDVPPRYLKQLEAGEVTFEQMLANVKKFLTAGKVIATGDVPPDTIDLSKQGGGGKPTAAAVDADMVSSYKTETY